MIAKLNDGKSRHAWLLCGDFDRKHETSLELARKLKSTFADSSDLNIELKHVSDLNDPAEVYKAISSIVNDAKISGLATSDIIADCTSGVRWVYVWLAQLSITGVRIAVLTDSIENGYREIQVNPLITWASTENGRTLNIRNG